MYLQEVDTVTVLYTGAWAIHGGKNSIVLQTVMRVSGKKTLFLFLFVSLNIASLFPYPKAVYV